MRRRRARAFSKTFPANSNVGNTNGQNQPPIAMQPTGYYPPQQSYQAPACPSSFPAFPLPVPLVLTLRFSTLLPKKLKDNAYRPDASGYTPHQTRIPPPSSGAPAPAYSPPAPAAAHAPDGQTYYAPPPGPAPAGSYAPPPGSPPMDPTNVKDK